jgi:hypothetical protein
MKHAWWACGLALALGCSSSPSKTGDTIGGGGDDGGSSGDDATTTVATSDASGFSADISLPEVSGDGDSRPPLVYANTDVDLWQMEPSTKNITRIGAFTDASGAAIGNVMTDVAVNAAGDLYGCSTTHIWRLALPAGGSGNVVSSQIASVGGILMYALGFAPPGTFGPGEDLVAGDANGDLYWFTTAGGTPTKVGTFGKVNAGDPGLGAAGDSWQLSGDIAFFTNGGVPVGLATLRPCTTPGDTSTCKNGNDVVAEIDMKALATKSATAPLLKRFLGSKGTGFGRIYGIGAWGDQLYGFQRVSTHSGVTSAYFIDVSLADGTGTVVKDFPMIASAANGWSGAGVTTSAIVMLPK